VADIIKAMLLKVFFVGGFTQEPGAQLNIGMIVTNDINILIVVIGLLFIAFSKEKTEDEHFAQLRLDSLQWAIYINYLIFILCVIFINGFKFIEIVAYNVITPLIFFIIRFRWVIFRLNQSLKAEKARS
jgi:hypothetical protein